MFSPNSKPIKGFSSIQVVYLWFTLLNKSVLNALYLKEYFSITYPFLVEQAISRPKEVPQQWYAPYWTQHFFEISRFFLKFEAQLSIPHRSSLLSWLFLVTRPSEKNSIHAFRASKEFHTCLSLVNDTSQLGRFITQKWLQNIVCRLQMFFKGTNV